MTFFLCPNIHFGINSIYSGFEAKIYLIIYNFMLNEILTPTESRNSFKTSHVTYTIPESYNNIYCGYCMIETSLSHTFDMFFKVFRVHCDNHCEIVAL
jgi:hypothetical protein